MDTPTNRAAYGLLAIITHTFTKRLPDGRPEPDYNHGLAGLDRDTLHIFDPDGAGVPVLVEIFGGKRAYYFYVRDQTVVPAAVASLKALHPGESLAGEVKVDPRWGFFDEYAAQYFGVPNHALQRTATGGWLSRVLRALFRR